MADDHSRSFSGYGAKGEPYPQDAADRCDPKQTPPRTGPHLSEAWQAQRSESGPLPEADMGRLELANLINADAFQNLMDDFYAIAHIPMSILDIQGRILAGVGWQEICTRFHRVHPVTSRHCFESDTCLSAGLAQGESRLYKCKNMMWDMATPVFVAGQHVGNVFTGQFFFDTETVDRALFRDQARKYGFDEQRYLDALDSVPRLNRETIDKGMSFFPKLAGILSQLGHNNVRLARLLAQRDHLGDSLRQSEERFRLALRNAPVSVAAQDRELRYIWAYNQRTARPEEIIGHFDEEIFTPEEAAQLTAIKRRVIDKNSELRNQMWFNRPGGPVYLDTYWEPIRDASGGVTGVASTTVDLTPIKLAEEKQKKNEERLELLAQVAERLLRAENPQIVVEDLCRLVMAHIDCHCFFNYLVEFPERRLQLNAYAGIPPGTADEIRQLDFGVAVCGCVAQEHRRIIAEDVQNSGDFRTQLIKSFGVQAYCCHPLMAQDKFIGTLSFGTKTRPAFADDEVALMKSVCDQVAVSMQRLLSEQELRRLNETLEQQVTERTRQAEARSRQLQLLAVELIEAEESERRRVADLLHDDLQQLLAAARMQMEAICRDQPELKALEHVRFMLAESINKSRRLCQELSPPVLQHSDLMTALEWLVRYFEDHFGLQVVLEAEGERQFENRSLKVFLFRAVQELLLNVAKHSGVKSARVDLTYARNGTAVTVRDKGRGLDAAILEVAAAPRGVGLLSLRERARHIGGTLEIDSLPGSGSRITLTVPQISPVASGVEESPVFPPIVPVPASRPPTPGPELMRVLFVDDHPVMRQGLIQMLASQPRISVAGEASNGLEAIEKVRLLKPDLVVMDVSMPVMDGVEATRHIKAQWPETRVLGLSMFEDEHISRKMIDAGAAAFISKTASTRDLINAIFGITD